MLKLIPKDSPHLDAIIARLRDPTLLWSDFGVRSLSKSDTFFGTAENYWRGPIWINMNFMILDGLSYYSSVSERAKDAFSALRNNLVSNLQNEYQRTGYLHEQYHPISGHGQRSKPFTGWTSLITLILAEDFQSFDYSSTN